MRPLTASSLVLALSLGAAGIVAPVASEAQIGFGVSVSVGLAPPVLPVYVQPPCPGDGYIWTPGYWAWSDYDNDYYWVPGAWVLPPRIGYLWTPAWWGWRDGAYVFNAGYWGPVVGFYGGINYGFGYTGHGYEGGYWRGPDFYYNRTVNNVANVHITNIYERPVSTSGGFNRVSFNGGPRGVQARPTGEELAAARAPRLAPTPLQQQHFQTARTDPSLRASFNHGAAPIAATPRPAMLRDPGVVPAAHTAAPYAAGGGGYRPTSRPAEHVAYNGGSRPPASANAGYHPPPRPTQNFNSGSHPAPRPPQPARVARPAPPPQAQHERRESGR